MAPVVKNLPANARRLKRHGFYPWVGKIPWRKKCQPVSSILAWRIPWTEEPGVLQSIALKSWTRLKWVRKMLALLAWHCSNCWGYCCGENTFPALVEHTLQRVLTHDKRALPTCPQCTHRSSHQRYCARGWDGILCNVRNNKLDLQTVVWTELKNTAHWKKA